MKPTGLLILILYISNVCYTTDSSRGDRQELSQKFSKLTFQCLSGSNATTAYLSPTELRKLASELGLPNSTEHEHCNGCHHHHHDNHHHDHHHHQFNLNHVCSHRLSGDHALEDAEADKFTIDDIMKLYNLNTTMTTSDFSLVCPALVFSMLAAQREHNHVELGEVIPPTVGMKQYLYGIVCTGIVCLASMVGIFLFPLLPESYYNALTSFMSSLAVGTLAGDALLHLIPHAYGLHSHSDHSGGEHSHTNECQGGYLMKTLVVILGIYIFYLIDVLTSKLPGGQDASHHHHHHHSVSGARNARTSKKEKQLNEQNKSLSDYIDGEDEEDAPVEHVVATQSAPNQKQSMRSRIVAFFRSVKYVQRYAWVVLIADSFHNVADGVTIGAAFGDSIKLGLTTTLAVLLHELPHELGDYAILITSGFTHLQALFFNLVTALTAYIGLLVGFLLSTSSEATQQWTLAAAAGIFLYVALVDLFPLLVPSSQTKNWDVVLYNAGLLLGFAIMFLLAAYEDQLKYSF